MDALHPTDHTLSSYGLGKLDDRSAEAVNTHLEECPDCRRRVAEMSSDSFLDRVRDAQKGSGKSTFGQSQAGWTQGYSSAKATTPPPADTLPPGLADHPDYEIKKELGRGGMGVVYLAHNKLMGRDEVLKVMGRHIMEKPGVLDRFLREIRAVAKLRHPNIVTAYAATRIGESIVFAMEYVDGLDLSKWVKDKGPLPVSHACNFVYQAALGLQHAHEEGLVHRDIKAANLMLSKKGKTATVKVLDFGLAKVTMAGQVDSGLTSEGQMLGTADYVAPEQILDAQSADIRADIYSLGGTLYYVLTGHPPFEAKTLYDLYQAHISRDAEPLNLIRPEVPSELAALVAKMLAKDPARRFQTPGEVAQALTPFFKKGSVAFKSPQTDVSQVGLNIAALPVKTGVSTPTQPSTDAGGSVIRPKQAIEPTVAEGHWENLIDFKETDSLLDSGPPVAPVRRPPWVWPAVAVGVLMFGLLAAWMGGVFKVKTTDGVIILENVPKDSEILVDGNKINFKWPGVGEFLEIRAVPGQRKVEVKKNGFKTFGEVVTVKTDESEEVTVRLEPINALLAEKDQPSPAQSPTGEVDLTAQEPKVSSTTSPAVVLLGSWRTEGALDLVQTEARTSGEDPSGTVGEILFGDPSLSSYVLHFKAMIEKGDQGFGAIFHRTNKDNMRAFFVGKHVEGKMINESSFLFQGEWGRDHGESKPCEFQLGHWYDVRIRVRGPEVRCDLDGKEWLSFADERFTRGSVGLITESSAVRFRDIALTTLEGTPIWKGPPRLPTTMPSTPLILSGTWSVDGSELVQSKLDGTCMLLLSPETLSRYDLKFKAKIVSGRRQFYALFHEQGGGHGGLFHLGNSSGRDSCLYFIHKDGKDHDWMVHRDPIDLGRWYDIRVKVRGPDVWCYLNDQELFHRTNTPLTRGRVGLATWETGARFRDISVTTPEGKDVWSGLPELPDQKAFQLRVGTPMEIRYKDIEIKELNEAAVDRDPFVPLFNGKDLAGWKVDTGDPGIWSVESGEIVARSRNDWRKMSFLLTDREYSDFIIRFEFFLPERTDSGVTIRAEPGDNPSPLELNLRNFPDDPPATHARTGAFRWSNSGRGIDYLYPDRWDLLRPGPAWNEMIITARGQSLKVILNGHVVQDLDLERLSGLENALPSLKRRSGRLGFQSHTGTVRFRKIEIKELNRAGDVGGQPNKVDRRLDLMPAGSRSALPITILSGTWRIEGNELVQSGGGGTVLLGDTPLSNYDLRFHGQIVSGNEGFVALFHRTSGDHVRFFHIGELAGKRVDAGFLYDGKEGGRSSPVATIKGQWYNVLVKVRGPEYWCYLDSKELFHNVDERFTKGRIGLATWDADARYRDISVITPDGKVLWRGLPDLRK